MLQQNNILSKTTTCFHCGDNCGKHIIKAHNEAFCCEGCKMVYEILQGNNLCNYYSLNNQPGLSQKVVAHKSKFEYLDSEDVVAKLIQFLSGNKTHIQLYLPQMHCSSCVWLLEQLEKINNGIESCTANFTNKEVFIIYNNTKTTLRKVVETLASIGYEPHINLQDINGKKITVSNKKRLLKIGVAGFCFSNIMMLSFPDYLAGNHLIEPIIHKGLQAISIGLSLPVLLYAAQEFFASAYIGLKNKYLNIDAPVALAIAITFCRSIYEIATHQGNGYLDSMSGIVFFMLVGRWLQEKTYQSISFDRDYKSFFPIALQVLKDSSPVTTLINDIKVNDVVIIHHNEVIPVDAIVSKGNCLIDYSFVTGEQMPVQKQVGDIVYAGGKQLNGRVELLVVKPVSQSYLTTLWNNDAFKRKSKPQPTSIDTVGKYFTYAVLAIGTAAAMYWLQKGNTSKMWNALTTVLIVACPCALLLASNYANGNVLKIFGKNSFYLRDASVLQQLKSLTHIVFDKTGTLTHNQENNIVYTGKKISHQLQIELVSVLSNSNHPLSKTLVKYFDIDETISIEHFKEYAGAGIEAWVNDQHIKIGSSAFINKAESNNLQTEVFIKVDDEVVGKFEIKNVYRKNIFGLLHNLKKSFTLSILSGDNASEAMVLSKIINDKASLKFNQSPINKLEYIQNLQQNNTAKVAMIGDGLNDAGALKISNVGIAITEGTNNFTPACDAVLDAKNITSLPSFLKLVKTNSSIIFSTFCISAIYNVIGLWFAVQGILSPVIAAILMPLSSITIIFLTYTLTRIMATKYNLKT